jgi:hypothetical protein
MPFGSRNSSHPPTPLLFAVTAVFHTAPPSATALARVEKVDLAVRGITLANAAVFNIHYQKVFDGQRASMQRRFDRSRAQPAIGGEAAGCLGDKDTCGTCQ